MKIYTKVGKHNYKEKRLLKGIEAALEKNPDLNVGTASNIEELQAIYNSVAGDEAEIISETKNEKIESTNMTKEHDETEHILANERDINLKETNTEVFVDPFNRENAIVRDYVTEQQFDKTTEAGAAKTTFEEPKTFGEAFYIPPAEGEGQIDIENDGAGKQGGSQASSGGSNQSGNSGAKKQSQNVTNPINPAYNDMDKKTKNRQNKRFAKFAVNAVCFMAEKGLVWLGTSNINQAKVIEYETSGEFDLDTILSVGEGEMSVRDFFATRCAQVEDLSKISEDEKLDLIESLAALLEEKGFTPTPMQTFLMNAGEVLLTRAAAIAALRFENKGIIEQLKDMKAQGIRANQQVMHDEEEAIRREEEAMAASAQETNRHAESGGVSDAIIEEETTEAGIVKY